MNHKNRCKCHQIIANFYTGYTCKQWLAYVLYSSILTIVYNSGVQHMLFIFWGSPAIMMTAATKTNTNLFCLSPYLTSYKWSFYQYLYFIYLLGEHCTFVFCLILCRGIIVLIRSKEESMLSEPIY